MSDTGKIISERLAQSRREKGWTLKETAASIHVGLSRYSNWELGLRVPRYDELVRLAESFGKSPSWLAGFTDHPGTVASGAEEYIAINRASIATRDGTVRIKNASDSTAFKADYLKRRDIASDKILLVYADDDAMADVIQHGDELLIDRSRTRSDTIDLFAFVVDGRAWVRWFRPEIDGTITLTAERSDRHPPEHLSRDQLNDLIILGRVARIARDR